jgi:hypothetical protein
VNLVDHVVSRVRRVRDRAKDQTTVQQCLHRAASWRPLSRSGAAAEDDILGRLSDDQIWSRGNENQNAVGNLGSHMCSNLRQWILSGVRDREAKFAARGEVPGSELAARLEATVADVFRGATIAAMILVNNPDT